MSYLLGLYNAFCFVLIPGNAEEVRARAQEVLMKLHDDNERAFAKFVRDMTVNRGLSEIVDMYHSLLGFCQNSTSLLSPTTQMKRISTSTAASNQDSASARTGPCNTILASIDARFHFLLCSRANSI